MGITMNLPPLFEWLPVCVLILTAFGLNTIWYCCCTPTPTPAPIRLHPWHHMLAGTLHGLAYLLSVVRLPFVLLPYLTKVAAAVLLRSHFQAWWDREPTQALRLVGDVLNLALILTLCRCAMLFLGPAEIESVLTLVGGAEALRLLAEKGQMGFSAIWQCLPHRQVACFLSTWGHSLHLTCVVNYCHYYALSDEARCAFILRVLRTWASADPDTANKLAYLNAFLIVPSSHGLRAGIVRDVAGGMVFIHRGWTNDPWLLIGQALRRTPWIFDPRYLPRPFFYRSQANPLVTRFVLSHASYSPPYAWYQFGHEIKAARYEITYRLLRACGLEVEPHIQADGTFPFEQGLHFLKRRFGGNALPEERPLWTDAEVVLDLSGRAINRQPISSNEVAAYYTYPLKYVEEVLLPQLCVCQGIPDSVASESSRSPVEAARLPASQ
jgi:hypothetical protein